MAESGRPLPYDDSPVNDGRLKTADDLSSHVTFFQDHIDLKLLVPALVEHKIITSEERHKLTHEADPPKTRTFGLITDILPSKGEGILKLFKIALEDTLKKDGSLGHQAILEKFFDAPTKLYSNSDADVGHQATADVISKESEEFSLLLINFRKILENGTENAVKQRLKDVADFLCILKLEKHKCSLLESSIKDKLHSSDLNFSKLLRYLESSNPPLISDNDVSLLDKIVDMLAEVDEGSKKIITPLKKLLNKYGFSTGIVVTKEVPQISAGNTRINVKVMNAHRSVPELKNGVLASLFGSLEFFFCGAGPGSVVFYWDVHEKYTQQLIDSFKKVCCNKIELHRLKITKVEVQLSEKPYQINLEMEIIDQVLHKATQKRDMIADKIAPDQEKFALLLIKLNRLVGIYAKLFLSTSRNEYSRLYGHFESNSFKEMIDALISEDKLHCYDISYIQQFLLSLLKWDISQSSEHKKLIIDLLQEAQDYEPVPTGCLLPSLHSNSRSNSVSILTNFLDFSCVSYEVMMTMKHILSHLLHLLPWALQYIKWKELDRGCQITWNTSPENFERIKNRLLYFPSTVALMVDNNFDIKYPSIEFNCNIKNMQILLDGSPLLCPDLDGKIAYSYTLMHIH